MLQERTLTEMLSLGRAEPTMVAAHKVLLGTGGPADALDNRVFEDVGPTEVSFECVEKRDRAVGASLD